MIDTRRYNCTQTNQSFAFATPLPIFQIRVTCCCKVVTLDFSSASCRYAVFLQGRPCLPPLPSPRLLFDAPCPAYRRLIFSCCFSLVHGGSFFHHRRHPCWYFNIKVLKKKIWCKKRKVAVTKVVFLTPLDMIQETIRVVAFASWFFFVVFDFRPHPLLADALNGDTSTSPLSEAAALDIPLLFLFLLRLIVVRQGRE